MELKIFFISMLFAGMCCCSVNISKIGGIEAESFSDKITYIKDVNTDLCFALIASRRPSSLSSSGIAMAEVSCEKVKNHLE